MARFLLCVLEKKEQVNIGVRQECASAVASKCNDGHAIGRSRALLDKTLVAAEDNIIYKLRTPLDDGGSIPGDLELFPQRGESIFIRFTHLAAGQKD